ncbi:hypothetical protein [Polaromonas sp. CG9_12]|nr:hypothetical protein [Polaromonas sp. CG9_12]
MEKKVTRTRRKPVMQQLPPAGAPGPVFSPWLPDSGRQGLAQCAIEKIAIKTLQECTNP